MKIKRSDKVKIVAGKDKGREGVVEKVFPKANKVLVAGANLYKKHARAGRGGKKGGIIDILKPLPVASIVPLCPKCGQATRFGYKFTPQKLRFCKKCQESV